MRQRNSSLRTPLRGTAEFDPTGRYRYTLTRRLPGRARGVVFILLNPSTASADVDDATIRRCTSFATRLGASRLTVVNLFTFCATAPKDLYQAADPEGAAADDVLLKAAAGAGRIIAGWGNHGSLRNRSQNVRSLLRGMPHLYCFGLTAAGEPRHPLYLPADCKLVRFHP